MSTTAKRNALRLIRSLPADATLEDIQYHLYFCQRIERGLAELAAGKTVSHEGVKRSVRRWLRSAGQ